MKGEFEAIIKKFPGWLDLLQKKSPLTRDDLSQVPDQGIYVYYNKENHPVYVGRSDRMKTRLQEHSRPSSGHTSATFAYLKARKMWKENHPEESRSRKELENDDDFSVVYNEMKKELAAMNVRVIEIVNPAEQALFEIYASLELGTPFNAWENH
jgi:predicted GIY-YIG superfamily endonuclease